MPSLRRSLILYFLLLLGLGLGVFGTIADQVIGQALFDKEAASTELIDRNARDRLDETREKFDRELLAQAQLVSRTANSDYAAQTEKANRTLNVVLPLVFVGLDSPVAPSSLFGASTAMGALAPPAQRRGGGFLTQPGPFFGPVIQAIYAPLRAESFLESRIEDEEHKSDFIQVTDTRGLLYKTAKLAAFVMPAPKTDAFPQGATWMYDDLELPDGAARRVILKAQPIGMFGGFRFGQPGAPPQPGGGGRGEPPRNEPPNWRFFNYYHVARLVEPLDEQLAAVAAEADSSKLAVRDSTAATQSRVRGILLLTGVCAFLGLIAGGWIVTGVGLSPLRKLTEAVSRVNEKAFRLPVDRSELTLELAPIHDRLTQSLDALRRAFEREKEAVADISHELRTPVAGLLATLDVALRKPRSAEQYRATLEDCRAIAKQFHGLVERVMTLAYLDAGNAKAQLVDIDLVEIAEECATVIRPLATAQGLQLSTDFDDGEPIATDPSKLREAIVNLLHNAVEYNRPGGSIALAVRRSIDAAVIEVADTGIGMSPDVLGKIFERFYRADSSRTATGVHAGLGLAIVKESVEQLGGRIEVESVPDRGSTFRIVLPLDRQ